MDKRYIEDNEIEIKYLRNQLAPEEAEEFEVYLMENPCFLEQLETTSVLMKEVPQVKPEAVTEIEKRSLLGSILTMKPLLSGYIAGAMTVVGVIGILSVSEPSVDNNPTFSQVVYLSPTRSAGELDTDFLEIVFPPASFEKGSKDTLILTVDANSTPNDDVEIYLTPNGSNTKPRKRLGIFKVDELGQTTFSIPTRNLSPGKYRLFLNNSEVGTNALFGIEIIGKAN
ncbi:hypothetical protein NBRC116583_02880 [Arenicella sp. 4NH20-0111]|uniref:hypothetical protein n=1 Tax=Arenicella sp. 4NH20-0111 TaxID=3127648 RepID=UPI00310A2CB6